MYRYIFVATLFMYAYSMQSQPLKAGFSVEEYRELMAISVVTTKSSDYILKYERPKQFRMIYQSGDIGLDNSWDMWVNDSGLAAISLRGSTEKQESWLENFYAAMIPAKGQIVLGEDMVFNYSLSEHKDAYVHAGWTVGLGFLAGEIIPAIDRQYSVGIRDFLIIGHSQGGGIAYLLTAMLRQMQNAGELPVDIRFKTYCSAAPKPGNLYFAYEYERMTQGGWAFNVINAADWVPEVPISIQTLDDFNSTNPFRLLPEMIASQSLKNRITLNHVYKKLNKPTRKAQKNYQKYLGNMIGKTLVKTLPDLQMPDFAASANYVRTGTHIILTPDEEYKQKFPETPSDIFMHHLHAPYLLLLDKLMF